MLPVFITTLTIRALAEDLSTEPVVRLPMGHPVVVRIVVPVAVAFQDHPVKLHTVGVLVRGLPIVLLDPGTVLDVLYPRLEHTTMGIITHTTTPVTTITMWHRPTMHPIMRPTMHPIMRRIMRIMHPIMHLTMHPTMADVRCRVCCIVLQMKLIVY